MFYYITKIEPNADNFTLKITYSDNSIILAEFKDLLGKGIMTVLKNPDIFNSVKIGNKGRSIIWQEQDIDFCADSLRLNFEKQTEIANRISAIRFSAKQLQQAAAELEVNQTGLCGIWQDSCPAENITQEIINNRTQSKEIT